MFSENILEIGLTAIGWEFYNAIVTFAVSLNLHLIPFVYMMLRNWWETARSQEAGHAATVELKRTTSDFITMALVVILFWIPNSATTFDPKKYVAQDSQEKFEPIASLDGKASSGIAVPVGWWFVMLGSKAMINQVIDWTSFDPRMTTILQSVSTAKITDPELRYQVNAFTKACHEPALQRWRYERQQPIPKDKPEAKPYESVLYIGSPLLLGDHEHHGYYKHCAETQNPCYGNAELMPPEVADRYNIKSREDITLSDGTPRQVNNPPSCYTWWTGNSDHYYDRSGLGTNYVGLRESLVRNILLTDVKDPSSVKQMRKLQDLIKTQTDSDKDKLVYSVLKADHSIINNKTKKDTSDMSVWQMLKEGLYSVLAAIGATIMGLFLSFALSILKPMLFMFQSIAIFGTLISASITLLIGGFRPQVALKHLGFFVGILILPLFWHAADYVNEALLKILYPETQTLGAFLSVDIANAVDIMLYFVFVVLIYIMLPTYFVKLMMQAGAEVVDMSQEAMQRSRDVANKGISGGRRGLSIGKGKKK